MAVHDRDATGLGERPDRVRRLAGLLAFVGIGATLTIVVATIQWPVVGPLAYPAIISVGSITAGALAVLGSVNKRQA
jgi:hypothetical protein